MKLFTVVTTVANDEEAAKLARLVIEQNLAACVQRMPIQSTYRWEGKIEESQEVLLQFKTTEIKASPLTKCIEALHSYQTPEILMWECTSASDKYSNWLKAETN